MAEKVENTEICGIVMPISSIDGCPEEHWTEVLSILTETIDNAGFEPNLVSHADDVGIIQKRIIQNLYENPIVVVDVSGKNPNVMFELGMRLAFDKPTIIIKDDKTSYSFDTSSIEHLEYPRDLRFTKIIEFRNRLKEKIIKTYKAANENPEYTTFLKHFGEFKVAKLDTKEVSGSEYIIEELKSIHLAIARLDRQSYLANYNKPETFNETCIIEIQIDEYDIMDLTHLKQRLSKFNGVFLRKITSDDGKVIIMVKITEPGILRDVENVIKELANTNSKRMLIKTMIPAIA